MLYEYALISVLIASGYWGQFFLRRRPHGTATYGLMLLGAAALAGLGMLGRQTDGEWLDVAGAIGIGAGTCLLVIGPVVRGAARRFASAERFGIAGRLLDLAEVLAPGSGVAEEKAVLAAMREIRDGRIEQTVDALTAARDGAPPEARVAIDERIALLYLTAYRWEEAISHAEAHLLGAAAPASSAPAGSLRAALGIAPPVWVELLGAYARTGDLEQAARMLVRLEDACAGRDDASIWIHRARLMFLALAGRTQAVLALVDRRQARHMSAAARTYWVGVAHENRGDREAAALAYEKSRAASRGRPREMVDQAIARLAKIEPRELSPVVTEVVARVEAAPLPAPIKLPRARRPWATWTLTAGMLGIAGAITVAVGPTSDLGVLLRAGAMVHGLVDAGEWWRLVSCVVVHVGVVHLLVNAVGTYVLARAAEELFGTARTIALFGLSGLAGSLASYLAPHPGVSAGASGAVFGVLGAVFVELTLHRERYRAAWKRGMWGGLALVAVAQVGVGFLYPMVDQRAHIGGLLGGVAFGALLSPTARWHQLGRHAGRVLAVGFVALLGASAALVVRTTVADSFDRAPRVRRTVGDVAVTAPATWEYDHELSDGDGFVNATFQRVPLDLGAPQLDQWVEAAHQIGKQRGMEQVEPAAAPLVALPAGWRGKELIGTFEDALGHRQRYRLIAVGRAFGDSFVVALVFTPESVAAADPGLFAALIGSIEPA